MSLDTYKDATHAYSVGSYMRHYDTQLDRSMEGNWRSQRRLDATLRKPAEENVPPSFSLHSPSAVSAILATTASRTRPGRPGSVASLNLRRAMSHTATGLASGAPGPLVSSESPMQSTGRRRVHDAPAARDHLGVLPHGLGPAHAAESELFTGNPAVEARLSASDRARMSRAAHRGRPTAALKNTSSLHNGPDGLGPG